MSVRIWILGSVVSVVVMGCGAGDHRSAGQSGSGVEQVSCNIQTSGLSQAALDTMTSEFSAMSEARANLSERERAELYIDRDAKGRIRHYATGAKKPTPPTIEPWAHKDLEQDKIPGTSTERAYKELALRKGKVITVAVLDSGMDITHEDLKDHIWENKAEKYGFKGYDDDHDGFVDDVHGWNFLGGKKGNINWTNLEVTREVRRMRELAKSGTLNAKLLAYQAQVEKQFTDGQKEASDKLANRTKRRDALVTALDTLKKACQISGDDPNQIKAIQSTDPAILAAKAAALTELENGWNLARFKSSIANWDNTLKYQYNLEFDPSAIVGDNPAQLDEKGYGNPSVMPVAEDEEHATHVAGIIGAVRGNKIGMDGQAFRLKIMSIRAVPNGDERDKDIANGIKFAADHGARVINMSFGKPLSPNKEYVWQAIDYAAKKNVLLVHAAGNDNLNNDTNTFYPSRDVTDENGKVVRRLENFIEVGASTRFADARLPAVFSDYGKHSVDLFAPGAQIYSSIPGNDYAEFDGTSMATPEVAGIAALIISQRPELTAIQVKQILMQTVKNMGALQVSVPGADPKDPMVPFADLSITGGIVNAYEALKLALSMK